MLRHEFLRTNHAHAHMATHVNTHTHIPSNFQVFTTFIEMHGGKGSATRFSKCTLIDLAGRLHAFTMGTHPKLLTT